ncbi:MAG TPA: DUF3471 domain-containing protein [Panacibacter sp.]|nr:DUF3471 domain-containing protein [Panacibacter sp.]
MNKIIIMLFILHASISAKAQLENTRWKATLIIDGQVNTIFDFKKDTCSIYTVADSTVIETMTYKQNDTTFTLLKIEGQSDCGNDVSGIYHFKVKDNQLFVQVLSDDCDDRASVLQNTEWKIWKNINEVKLNESILKQYTGVYALDDAHPIYLTLDGGQLYAEGPNNRLPKSPLIAESETKFFLRIAGVEWDFIKGNDGKVIKLISHEEKDYELRKIK